MLALGLVTGLVVIAGLFWRAHDTNSIQREICAKVDRLDSALITIVTQSSAATRTRVTVIHADGTRERLTVLVPPQRADDSNAASTLRSAACDPHNIGP